MSGSGLDGIRRLVAQDELERATSELLAAVGAGNSEISNELIALRGALARAAKQRRLDLDRPHEVERARTRARYVLLELLDKVEQLDAVPASTAASTASVFLSYNHEDIAVAQKLRAALEAAGIRILIDADTMRPGEDVAAFVTRCIRDTQATVCIISNRSLLSAWVALETVQAFDAERFTERRFIACGLDREFFAAGYRLERTKDIDARIQEIEALLPGYAAQRLDTEDLNAEKSRLYALRNNLGRIVARLKDSLALDLNDDHFDASVRRIIRELQPG